MYDFAALKTKTTSMLNTAKTKAPSLKTTGLVCAAVGVGAVMIAVQCVATAVSNDIGEEILDLF